MSREAREEPKPYPPYPLGPPEKPAGGVRDVRLGLWVRRVLDGLPAPSVGVVLWVCVVPRCARCVVWPPAVGGAPARVPPVCLPPPSEVIEVLCL